MRLNRMIGTIPLFTGDFIFVGAGEPHRFEELSPDFETWVILYGPEGGEG
jgi:hypothetical protein